MNSIKIRVILISVLLPG